MGDVGDRGKLGDSGEGIGEWNRGDDSPSAGNSNLSVPTDPSVVMAVPGLTRSSEGGLLLGERAGGNAGTSGTSPEPVLAPEALRSFLDSSSIFGLEIERLLFFFFPSCAVVGLAST